MNYTYNAANRLVRVEDDLTGLLIAEYGYDPFGRRLWKEVDGVRTYFLYSDEGLVAEYDEAGVELRSYGWKPGSTWGTNPLWLKQNGEYYWYQNDHLGTPQKLVDSSGTVVWSATYSAFGEASIDIELVTNNLRFPGQYYDAETGLHYNWFRYYEPEIGRYIQADPIGVAGGLNLFSYSLDNPINYIDELALKTDVIITKSLYGKWIWYGSHAAVRIDSPGISEGRDGANTPKLFDPGGGYYKDYQNPDWQGSAILGWVDNSEADLWPYIQYHLDDKYTSWVIVHSFDTTLEDEACIFKNMDAIDPGGEFFCAKSTYFALAGCGPFKDLEDLFWISPAGLDKKLQESGIPHERFIFLETLPTLSLLSEFGFFDTLQYLQDGTLPDGGTPIN